MHVRTHFAERYNCRLVSKQASEAYVKLLEGLEKESDSDSKPVNFPSRDGLNSLFNALNLSIANPLARRIFI